MPETAPLRLSMEPPKNSILSNSVCHFPLLAVALPLIFVSLHRLLEGYSPLFLLLHQPFPRPARVPWRGASAASAKIRGIHGRRRLFAAHPEQRPKSCRVPIGRRRILGPIWKREARKLLLLDTRRPRRRSSRKSTATRMNLGAGRVTASSRPPRQRPQLGRRAGTSAMPLRSPRPLPEDLASRLYQTRRRARALESLPLRFSPSRQATWSWATQDLAARPL